jgi:hypothetical protein
MRPEVFVIIHVVFGMFGILAALWMFVETLNSTETNQKRIEIDQWAAKTGFAIRNT